MNLGIAMIILLSIVLTFSITIMVNKIKNKRQK